MKYPPNYFQGILQLRDCNVEVIDFVNNQVEKAGRGDVYVSKEVGILRTQKEQHSRFGVGMVLPTLRMAQMLCLPRKHL